MKKLKFIQYFLLTENIKGIYRNYLFYGRRSRKRVLFCIIFEILLNLVLLVNNLHIFEQVYEYKVDSYYYFVILFVFLSNFTSIVFSVLKSLEYKMAVTNLMIVHDDFIEDSNYKNNLKQLKTVIIVSFTVLFIIIFPHMVWQFRLLTLLKNNSFAIIIFFWCVSLLCNKINFILDFFALYIYIDLLSNLLKCLNSTVLELEDKMYIEKKNKSMIEINKQNLNMLAKIQRCAEWYACLVESSKQLSECFKYQVNI